MGPALTHPTEIWSDPFHPARATVTVVTTAPTGGETTETTDSEADRSFIERALAPGGLLFLRLAVVALAAFVAGAVVQRAFLGDFALKLGPLEVPDLPRQTAAASEEAVSEITAELRRQADATQDAMNVAADAAEAVDKLSLAVQPLIELIGAKEEDKSATKEEKPME